MKSIVLTLALLASTFPVIADDINWYRATANGSLFIDMLQTVEISKNDSYYETNKIMGPYPSEREVYQYFILAAVITNVIGEALPDPYSNLFYVQRAFDHGVAIHSNIQLGVNIQF